MGAEQQIALTTTASTVQAQLRSRVLAALLALFRGLGSWRDADRDRFVALAVPLVAGAQRQTAALVDAYLAALLADMRGVPARPTGRVPDLTAVRGVAPAEVYGRPFADVWSELAAGRDLSQALAVGRLRLQQIAATDLELAKTHAARELLDVEADVVGFRRVLIGSTSCGLCVVASTQRYHRGELLPIHPGCDCGVAPILGSQDPGHVLNESLLGDVHAAIQDRFGVSRRTARDPIDYRDLIVTHEHGEIGPVLARRGDDFTGPGDVA